MATAPASTAYCALLSFYLFYCYVCIYWINGYYAENADVSLVSISSFPLMLTIIIHNSPFTRPTYSGALKLSVCVSFFAVHMEARIVVRCPLCGAGELSDPSSLSWAASQHYYHRRHHQIHHPQHDRCQTMFYVLFIVSYIFFTLVDRFFPILM